MEFTVLKGNIIDSYSDAIVLPANPKLKKGSGTSAAIYKTAGPQLAKECDKLAPRAVGSAVATYGYNMDCKFIIHAIVPKWKDGQHNEYQCLSEAYLSSLQLADRMELKSISFPLLAAGNNGFDLSLAFQIAAGSIREFSAKHLKNIFLVLYENNVIQFARGKGLKVEPLDRSFKKDDLAGEQYERWEAFRNDMKEVLQIQLQKGIDYCKDPENMDKIADVAKKIIGVLGISI